MFTDGASTPISGARWPTACPNSPASSWIWASAPKPCGPGPTIPSSSAIPWDSPGPWPVFPVRGPGQWAVNAFPRFTRAQDFVAGTPPRHLDRMIERFAPHPHEVTADFMPRCGIHAADTETIRPAPHWPRRLKWLPECDETPNHGPSWTAPLLGLGRAPPNSVLTMRP
uniref:Hydrolases or acyltransferases (Alpha/beta hydrolase superfamily) n=1 Tax=Magnetospirillum gryphiswaldense TaxID=55518 RepID=A4TXR4_9PROT|nr:hydrolases or acyltransferases (alpha/beta hydrolase superfamily) [Magnetospirillum gryphiswaldense MSR-1]